MYALHFNKKKENSLKMCDRVGGGNAWMIGVCVVHIGLSVHMVFMLWFK